MLLAEIHTPAALPLPLPEDECPAEFREGESMRVWLVLAR